MAVKPSIPKGTRDFTPEQVAKRNYIFNMIRTVFEKYGYQPIETPTMENLSTLTGKYGEEGDQLLFKVLNSGNFLDGVSSDKLKSDNAKQLTPEISEKGLRYDLTVPFARYVVMHQNEITFPFKRYQIQPVFRADRPQRGRYREFYQCDADVVGSDSLLNEVELIQIYDEVFTKLGIPVSFRINNRKILQGFADIIGAPDRLKDIAIAIDKIDKIGKEGVKSELLQKEFSAEQANSLFEHFAVLDVLNNYQNVFNSSPPGIKGAEELNYVKHKLNIAGFDYRKIVTDLSLARGLNYYTGIIIEVSALDIPMGSLGGGGRYDDLTGMFGLPNVSGVGISFGVDRIYDVMEELEKYGANMFPKSSITTSKVLFVNFNDKSVEHILPLLQQIRDAGIYAELYPSSISEKTMKKQLGYANDKKIPFVILVGEDEINDKEKKVTLKNMVSGGQESLTMDEIISKLK